MTPKKEEAMFIHYKKKVLALVLILSVMPVWLLPASPVWCQTFVSGRVITSDGMVVAGGAVALEKGELHNNAFLVGAAIGTDGTFNIPLPSGGPWGLHVYSEKYIYFPLQIQINEGSGNEVPVILPVDGSSADDPRISNIRFTKISDQVFQISMRVEDPNKNLGPQMLVIDTKRFRSYRLIPKAGDLQDKKSDFPDGMYVSPYIPLALEGEDLSTWRFVVADHQCSNGAVYNGLGQSVFRPPRPHLETLSCDVSGIWKSNFDKAYRFTLLSAGAYKGEQLEGRLLIDQMVQKDDNIFVDFRFQGKKGRAELRLLCSENAVTLKGTFHLPDKSEDWTFTKLQNAQAASMGEKIFETNCSGCHYHDRKETKVGPGLLELFQNPRLPTSGRATSAKTVREQIINGGNRMPPFKHLKKEEITALIDYLKSI